MVTYNPMLDTYSKNTKRLHLPKHMRNRQCLANDIENNEHYPDPSKNQPVVKVCKYCQDELKKRNLPVTI